jgi:hypothetical protein
MKIAGGLFHFKHLRSGQPFDISQSCQTSQRLAGIDEAGATETLRFIPTDEAVMEKFVSMYDHRKF